MGAEVSEESRKEVSITLNLNLTSIKPATGAAELVSSMPNIRNSFCHLLCPYYALHVVYMHSLSLYSALNFPFI